jgi:RNA polymerase sigma-70 factor (ECF subfamily)
MEHEDTFRALMRRVRAGDAEAAAELFRTYEPEIRRILRFRMRDARQHRVLDPEDICQSVMATFFVRAAAGQYDLERPDQLLRLLVTMAQNKLVDKVRRHQADRRDQRRVEAGAAGLLDAVADRQPTPSQIVAGRELLPKVLGLLTDEERYLAEQRALGRTWQDLAQELGANSEALRKRLKRALDRAFRELGLGEETSD